ncbi:BREX-2 system adenine-specific DNA-methyltransferase PglX, partial [Mycobacterium sp. 29Ha]|uniref:BREX-2 system adenine-specific DNA-methyltransferase PglX n=1 Tax=Mycobacterium sp. 29Ha TaxID=2939268 RepID=UPI002938FC3B
MGLATVSGGVLTAELRPQVGLLVDDMRERLNADTAVLDRWRSQHREAVAQELTAGSFTDWVDDQLTQAAVGWLLTSVFVRFCEDNLLLGESGVWITHADVRLRQRALDTENAFYQADPDRSYREWLEVAFAALRANRATAPLVDEHAAIGIISPSSDAVHQLLSFWRRTDDDGNLLWRFDDDELSTRFLGDLYQDLSDHAKDKYALFQTPVFVEEFILEQTLIPALAERPLEGFKVIDPTCGSGHFLLGAFEILVNRWHREAPGMEARARVNKALESVYGVDVNPFATAIAMFRLIVAALKQTGDRSLVNAPAFTLNLASGDSLLHGPDALGRTGFDYGDESFDKDAVASRFSYRTEDVPKLRRILAPGQYDVVVGNPPYPPVKDKALNARYRDIYHYCKGTYAITVPFMERFFQLAKPGEQAGWVGQITSNSFMKRRFGVPVIEKFLAQIDLRLVADTSGAYLPGHGTPTVILVGRNHGKVRDTVRAVLGIQSEPGTPDDPAKGKVWSAISTYVDTPGHQDQWVTVTDLSRELLEKYPWSLSGGGAVELQEAINRAGDHSFGSVISGRIGFASFPGADDAYSGSAQSLNRFGIDSQYIKTSVIGEAVRDWNVHDVESAFVPYTASFEEIELDTRAGWYKRQWPMRRTLKAVTGFGGETQADGEHNWWTWYRWVKSRYELPISITFAEIATHNHFVLDRGGRVFKQTAPVAKLSGDATELDFLRLLGTLNSSTVCFWLKQNCFDKGRPGAEAAGADELWEHRFQFSGTTLGDLPLPKDSCIDRSHRIDLLGRKLILKEPRSTVSVHGPVSELIDGAKNEHAETRRVMASEQEELDWEVYYNYGL